MIVNFTLDKISIEKTGISKGTIEAKNSIKFLDVAESTLPETMKDQHLIKFKFQYKISYLPNIATTEIIGHIHFMSDKQTKDKILKAWDKESKIDQSLSRDLVNYLFQRCSVMALSLSQQVGLPPHIALPKIAIKSRGEEPKKEKPRAS
ncbi:MAG: hypothetical protein Q8Q42_00395 [Nanoarchaeota archaeon]|nr:hypothetical protein [Nanoarchaeota archaeon]